MVLRWPRLEEETTLWRAVPFVALLMLLAAAVSFAPFPRALLGYRSSPFVLAAGLSLALAVVAILLRAFKPSRLLSVLSLLLAAPVFLLLLLATAVFFAPFPLLLLDFPLVLMAGLSFVLAVVAILSRESKPSRRLSVLSLLLAASACIFFSREAYQLRGLYRLHAVATEACRAARENPQLTSEAVFEQAARLAKLSHSQRDTLVLNCKEPGTRVYITNGFDMVWALSAEGILN